MPKKQSLNGRHPAPWISAVRSHLEVDGRIPAGTFPRLAKKTGIPKRRLVAALVEGWRPRREMDFVLLLSAGLEVDTAALMDGRIVKSLGAIEAGVRMTGRAFRPVLECAADPKLRAQLVKAAKAILEERSK